MFPDLLQLTAGPHAYACVMAPITGDAAAQVLSLAASIPDEDLADDGRETDPHVTVLYGLHGDDPAAVRTALAGEGPIAMTLGKTKVFAATPDRPCDVVVLEVDSPDLHRLNAKLAELPNTNAYPEYRPHATLAYVKPGRGTQYAGRGESVPVSVDRLVFSAPDNTRTEIPLMPTRPSGTFYLAAPAAELTRAATVPAGLPAVRNGLPCFYYWGDGLIPGHYKHPTKGFELDIAASDIDELCATFGRTAANAVDVPIVCDHVESAKSTLGYIVGLKHEGGRGWLLHQFLGEDARDCGLRNKISVGIDLNFKDGKGNAYGRAIRHSAATPMPVITGQKGFVAALSGSAPTTEPLILSLAAAPNKGGHPMTPEQLAAAKLCTGRPDLTAENAVDVLLSHAKGLATRNLSLQVKPEKVQALSAVIPNLVELSDADIAALPTLPAKVVELGRQLNPTPVDPEILADRAENVLEKIELSVAKGEMPAALGTKLKAMVKKDGKPSVFMLSQAADLGARPINAILDLFKGEKLGTAAGVVTGVQVLSRSTPDGGADDKQKQPENLLLSTAETMYGKPADKK
jgi:hypothetical protein